MKRNLKTESMKKMSESQWAEIGKVAAVFRIKMQIADLLELSPELKMEDLFEFLQYSVKKEVEKRLMNQK